jgi:hypothetical protein
MSGQAGAVLALDCSIDSRLTQGGARDFFKDERLGRPAPAGA